jgi:hypothetical protein
MLCIPNKFGAFYSIIDSAMKLIALISSYIVLCLRLLSPDGMRAIAAEKRVPKLTFFELRKALNEALRK